MNIKQVSCDVNEYVGLGHCSHFTGYNSVEFILGSSGSAIRNNVVPEQMVEHPMESDATYGNAEMINL